MSQSRLLMIFNRMIIIYFLRFSVSISGQFMSEKISPWTKKQAESAPLSHLDPGSSPGHRGWSRQTYKQDAEILTPMP